MTRSKQPEAPSRIDGTGDSMAPASERMPGSVSGKLVALAIIAVVLIGASLAWILLPF